MISFNEKLLTSIDSENVLISQLQLGESAILSAFAVSLTYSEVNLAVADPRSSIVFNLLATIFQLLGTILPMTMPDIRLPGTLAMAMTISRRRLGES